MKITCTKSNFSEGINIVLKAVPGKTTMPILECLVFEAGKEKVKLTTNDMEIGIETFIDAQIEEEGSILINAKMISDLVRKLPDDDVHIQTDNNQNVFISCGKSKFSLSGMEADEFPVLPTIEKSKEVTISEFMLKEMIRQTVFSISDNESNKILTGELFEIKGNEFKIVSLDGHRVSVRKMELKDSYDHIKVVVPGKTLNEISKILTGGMENEVHMYFNDKHILFEFGVTKVLSRLIEGNYYNIDQMLSSDYETKITVNKNELYNCIDRSTLLLRESDKKPIVMNIQDGTMKIEMNSQIGSMDEDIAVEKEGEDLVIAFNPKFLTDALRVIDDEQINIYLINSKSPCYIKNSEESYIYLILPVNLKG